MLIYRASKCRNRKRNQFSLHYLYERSLLMLLLLALHITVIQAFVLQDNVLQTSTPTITNQNVYLSKATHDDLDNEARKTHFTDEADVDGKPGNKDSNSVITKNNIEHSQLMSGINEDNKTLQGVTNDILYPERIDNVVATSEPEAGENLENSIRNSVKSEILPTQNLSLFLTKNAIEGITDIFDGVDNKRPEDNFLQQYHSINEITSDIPLKTDTNTITENIEYVKNDILSSPENQTTSIKKEKLDKSKAVIKYVQVTEFQPSAKIEAQSNSDCSDPSHLQTNILEKTDDSEISSSPKGTEKLALNTNSMALNANITEAKTNKQKADHQLSSAEFENSVTKWVTTSENMIKSHASQGPKTHEIHFSEIQKNFTKNKIRNVTDNFKTNIKVFGENNIKLEVVTLDYNEVLGSKVKENSPIEHRAETDIHETLSTSERSLAYVTFETTETYKDLSQNDNKRENENEVKWIKSKQDLQQENQIFASNSTSDEFYLLESTTTISDHENTISTFFKTDDEDNFDAMFESTSKSTENDLTLYTETEDPWQTMETSPNSDLEDQISLTTQHPLEAFEIYDMQEFNTAGEMGKALLSRSSSNDHFKIRPIMFILLCAISVLFIVFSVIIYLISFQRQHGTLNIEMQEQRCGKDTFDEEFEKHINLLDVESSVQIPITDESEECLQKRI